MASVMHLLELTDADFLDLSEGLAPIGLTLPSTGLERPEVLRMLRDLANTIRPTFSPACWMMVEECEVVGLCSIVKQPSTGCVDIGYGVSLAWRRSGFATAAVSALLEWALNDDRVQCIRAETAIDNIYSQRVLQLNGFDHVGERLDEHDGQLICWSASTKNSVC